VKLFSLSLLVATLLSAVSLRAEPNGDADISPLPKVLLIATGGTIAGVQETEGYRKKASRKRKPSIVKASRRRLGKAAGFRQSTPLI
jgi:L-asparaginase/Glu-tRNA(Gln) amidotransferase subunit D